MIVAEDNEEDSIPLSAYKPDGATESRRARKRDFVRVAKVLVEKAQSATCREEWLGLIHKVMVERMDSAHNSGYVELLGVLGLY